MVDSQRVAFQGSPGAYSHLACQNACPGKTVVPCPSFDAVFDAVEDRTADLAMLPVENSLAGRVADIHRLLPQRDLFIIGEHYLPVRHHLLAPPGATLEGIRAVRSHPQALAQCRRYLKSRGIKAVASTDTAGSAAEVAEMADPAVGAIASSIAGTIYGLSALDANIQDDVYNTTRFIIMSRAPVDPPLESPQLITSCLFRTRNVPAALYKALGGFATNGVNIRKLESYQLGGTFRWTQFAIDIEGHPRQPHVRNALEELQFFSTEVRMLGSYEAHDFIREV